MSNAIDTLLRLSASPLVDAEECELLQSAALSLIADDETYVELGGARKARKAKKKDPKRDVPTPEEQAEIDRYYRSMYPQTD